MGKVKHIKIGQASKRRWVSLRTRLVLLNVWAVAWYAFLAIARVLLYKSGVLTKGRGCERWQSKVAC